MGSRAQASRILIYAMTAVIGVMLLIFGYRALTSITSSSEKILLNEFHTSFTRDVDLGSSYGAVQSVTYHLPKQTRELCLIDPITPIDPAMQSAAYRTVADSWQSDAQSNVFLLPGDQQFTVDTLRFADCDSNGRNDRNFLCVKVKGTVQLRLYGEGNATRVETDADCPS